MDGSTHKDLARMIRYNGSSQEFDAVVRLTMATAFQEWLRTCMGKNESRSHQTRGPGTSNGNVRRVPDMSRLSFNPADARTLMTLFNLSSCSAWYCFVDHDVVHVPESTVEAMKKFIHFPHEHIWCGRHSE